MDLKLARYWFVQVAHSFLGRWYIWGGDDVLGFDCSGMTIEALKAVGFVPQIFDTTAEGLWQKYKDKKTSVAQEGCLLFWFGRDGKAIHVAIAVDEEYCITADGGGSKTLTVEDAAKQNAFIKIRRIDHRLSYPAICNIFT